MTEQEEPKTERFNMFISKSEVDAIDDWAWKSRIRSKSEAVRRLVQYGLVMDAKADEVLHQAVAILDRRTQNCKEVEELEAPDLSAISPREHELELALNILARNALEDQARLCLTLINWLGPLSDLKDQDFEEAVRAAEKARDGLSIVAEDTEVLNSSQKPIHWRPKQE